MRGEDGRDLSTFSALPPATLTSKEWLKSRVSSHIFWLAVLAVVSCLVFAGLGVFLVLQDGERGTSTLSLFGSTIETASVGLACIFISAVALVWIVVQVVRVLGNLTK